MGSFAAIFAAAVLALGFASGPSALLKAHDSLDQIAASQMLQGDLASCRQTLRAEDWVDRLDSMIYRIDIATVRPC